ncbi:MAG: exopolyphosphatase [Lachnospiraceae bacterium]|jgi:exopolyphosphatase/guanosine-5'-triphosphate,3'-diphosphate pyrophosphatase|nr:exopolyphosphatase [Lachnospiraceae bacterium]
MPIHRFAAIDVGSFEMELGVYEFAPGAVMRRIDHVRQVIPLGRETYNTGLLSHASVEEMCRILKDFQGIMKSYKVEEYRAYATSALREAKNNRLVLDHIRVRTGIRVSIISNSEQRLLTYRAIAVRGEDFAQMIQDGAAVVEVGFGSTQISIFEEGALSSTQNILLGSLRVREMVAQIPAGSKEQGELIREIVDNDLVALRKIYLKDRIIGNVVGVGDAATRLSMLFGKAKAGARGTDKAPDKATVKGNPKRVLMDNGAIDPKEFAAFHDRTQQMSYAQLGELFEVAPDIAALLAPGMMIYRYMIDLTGAKRFWAPDVNLCEGIAAEYGAQKKYKSPNHDFGLDILMAARSTAKRYKSHTKHIQNMESHVMKLFDSTKSIHGLSGRDRLLMHIAAVLHDCGKFMSMRNPGGCAYDIIMATEIIGLSHREREIIANVVRYNQEPFDYEPVLAVRGYGGIGQTTGYGGAGAWLGSAQAGRGAGTGAAAPGYGGSGLRHDAGGGGLGAWNGGGVDDAAAGGDAGAGGDVILIAKLVAMLRLANALDKSHRQKLTDCTVKVKKDELVITTPYDGNIELEKYAVGLQADFFEEIFGVRPILRQKRGL